MPQADTIQFDFSDIDFSRWRADRAYMEAVIERAARRRRIRLARLQQRKAALLDARTAIYRLSEAGSHPHTVRLRRRFVRLKTRRERDADPERHPQRAGLHPGRLAVDQHQDIDTRPPMTRLVWREGWGFPLYLTAVFEAHCAAQAGRRIDDRERPLATGPRGDPWKEPWSRLLGDPASSRNRRVHVTRALEQLAHHGLVELGRPRTLHRFEGFKLLSDSGDGTAYTVPGDSRRAALYLPPTFFLNGWHLVLDPREIATWLMLYELATYHTARQDGVGVVEGERWGRYGVTSETYEAHHELAEFGLLQLNETMPDRRRGRLPLTGPRSWQAKQRRPAAEATAAGEEQEGQRREAYRFFVNPGALDRDAFDTVSNALRSVWPPRFIT
jgi:hypothetical protein